MINPTRSAALAYLLSLFTAQLAFSNGHMGTGGDQLSTALAPMPAPCDNCCPESPAGHYFRTGFYVGGQVGYVHMDAKNSGVYTDAFNVDHPFSHHSDPDGVIGDVFVGGRFVFNNCFVAGMEMSGSLLTTKADHDFSFNNGTRNFQLDQSRRFAFIPSFLGGYIFADRWMVYGRLGVAVAEFRAQVSDLDNVTSKPVDHGGTRLGLSVVAGVECGFTSTMSARAEIGGEFYESFGSDLIIRTDQTSMTTDFQPDYFTAKVGVVVKI